MDMVTKHKRSEIMSKIRSKNTSVEHKLRKELWSRGIRYRIHYATIGKPDIVIKKYSICIFVDGCFWHGCPRCYRKPKSNIHYWKEKIIKNKKRDKIVTRNLKKEGWVVLRFWEHQINNNVGICVRRIISEINRVKDDPSVLI